MITPQFLRFRAVSPALRDPVRYRIGFGPLGSLALRLLVRRDVEGIFDYRRAAITELIRSRQRQALTAG